MYKHNYYEYPFINRSFKRINYSLNVNRRSALRHTVNNKTRTYSTKNHNKNSSQTINDSFKFYITETERGNGVITTDISVWRLIVRNA